ncbi:hypothetical protein ABK040_000216 [Willaertia magna]
MMTKTAMITVFLKEKSIEIPFDTNKHNNLEDLKRDICETYNFKKQFKLENNELITISNDESWKILMNELLKFNPLILYAMKEKKFKLTKEEKDERKKAKNFEKNEKDLRGEKP